jgi:hypothetical protein
MSETGCAATTYKERTPWGKPYAFSPTCESCGIKFPATKPDKKFCSVSCRKKAAYKPTPPKPCKMCGELFVVPKGFPAKMYCSAKCGQTWRLGSGSASTAAQNARVSGNWRKYYQRRIGEKKRRGVVTLDEIMALHEKQAGRCALTGRAMTCLLLPGGRTFTNASLDRIDPKAGYNIKNIQLVCVAVNMWRSSIPLDEFVEWCRDVVTFHDQKDEVENAAK